MNKQLYKRRKAIKKQPYGTLKRQWGVIMTRNSSKRARADMGLMMTVYNLRRNINILDMERFREHLQDRTAMFFSKSAILERVLDYLRELLKKSNIGHRVLVSPKSANFNSHSKTRRRFLDRLKLYFE